VPVAIVYSFFVEYYVTGLTGSVKGLTGSPVANVTIRKLNKQYENGFHAVKDVNIEIRDKEFMVLGRSLPAAARRRRCEWSAGLEKSRRARC
jgi:hypothetical protein